MLLRSGDVEVRIRYSARARRVRIMLVPGSGPVLVVPSSFWMGQVDIALEHVRAMARARARAAAAGGARAGAAGRRLARRRARSRCASCPPKRMSADWSAGALELRAPDDAGAAAVLERWYRELGTRGPERVDRAPGAGARRHAEAGGGARPEHALGLVLVARHALVLVAAAARAGLGARRRRLPRALPHARAPITRARSGRSSPSTARGRIRAPGCARTAASSRPTDPRIASAQHEHDGLRDVPEDVPAAGPGRLRVHARRGRALGGAASGQARAGRARPARRGRGARSASASSRRPRGGSRTRSRGSASRPASARS